MISLNKVNGDLTINHVTLHKNMSREEIENTGGLTLHSYDNWKSYVLRDLDGGDSGIGVQFYKNELLDFSIHLGVNYREIPYDMTPQEEQRVRDLLLQLGGEQQYSWGRVDLDYDAKGGGGYSIYISFGNPPRIQKYL